MIKKILMTAAASAVLLSAAFQAQALKREQRATWMSAYVADWPSSPITVNNAEALKTICQNNLDSLQRNNFTTIYYHARTMCDAMYDSKYEPWSSYVSSTRGVAPAFDPMAYLVENAHKRGIEVYAWMNPYRYINSTYSTGWGNAGGDKNYENSHPDWLIKWENNGRTWTILNPALPEVKQRIIDVTIDLISKYDVDGVVFDDYFYQNGLPASYDAADYAKYTAAGGTMSQLDWRRENVNDMVRQLYAAIKAAKPWVRFGIGPAGVAGKHADDYGLEPCPGNDWQYDGICSDPLAWLSEGTIDFISPQVYWKIGYSAADYAKITPWWYKAAAKFNRQCFISQDLSNTQGSSCPLSEFYDQITMTHTNVVGECPGTVYFPWKSLSARRERVDGKWLSLFRYLRNTVFDTKALTPATTWEKVAYPGSVSNVARSGRTLTWNGPDNVRFTVYAVPSNVDSKHFYKDAQYLIGNSYSKSFEIPAELPKYEGFGISDANLGNYRYAVAVLDRYGNEYSAVFEGAAVTASEKPVMTYPVNGELASKGFQFKWNGSAEVSEIAIATDAAMKNVVARFEANGNAASSAGMCNFEPDVTYYWTVTARGNNATDTEAGKVESFMVDIFRLISPADGSGNVELTPTISWSDLGKGTSYQLLVSSHENFQSVVIDETTTATSFAVPQYVLSAGVKYYAKVIATVNGGTETTDVFEFTTKAASIPTPTFVTPAASGTTLYADQVVAVQPVEGVASTHFAISEKETFPARTSYNGTYPVGTFCTPVLSDVKLVSKKLEDGKSYFLRAQFNYYVDGKLTTTDWTPVLSFTYNATPMGGVDSVAADGITIVDNVLSTGVAGMPVAVFALDGKQVLNAETDAQGNADLSVLAGGTYLVSIVVDGAVKTVKFVRK